MKSGIVLRDIPYADAHARHLGDLHLPAQLCPGASPVLLIHGGSWNALTKESLDPIARLAATEGRAVFNINYRLIGHAPWPACRDDCVAAARFVLSGGLAPHGLPAPADAKLLVVGSSAGGHLAMMTGLALGARACAGIVSLAGPSRVDPRDDVSKSVLRQPGFLAGFFGYDEQPTSAKLHDASPAALVTPEAPPLRVIHSTNDRLVPRTHSEEAATAWRGAGVPAHIDYFHGRGDLHGFWTTDELDVRELVPVVTGLVREALKMRID